MKFKIILTIALFSPFLNAEQVKIENPLKKNFFMMVINDGLSLSKKSGEYVHEIKLAGECARDTLKHLHTLSNCKTKPELEILYKSLNKEVTDLVSKEEAILKQEIFNNVKKQLIDPRQKFFEMLLEHATYLKEPVRLSLSTVKTIDLEASILLKLLDVKADEAIIFLNAEIKDEVVLKQLCTEFVTLCKHLWDALSDNLKAKRLEWLKTRGTLIIK